MAELSEFLSRFRELHQRAKTNVGFSSEDRQRYEEAKRELATIFLEAQKLTLKPNEQFRRTLRVPLTLAVRLEIPPGGEDTSTIDLSIAGFAGLVQRPPRQGAVLRFSLRISDRQTVEGRATAVWVPPGIARPARVSFMFKDLSEPHRDALEMIVFDCVLARVSM
jgi:hypothetical protein